MTSRLGDLLTARDWWDGLWGVMTAEQVTMVVLGASGGCLYYKCFFSGLKLGEDGGLG